MFIYLLCIHSLSLYVLFIINIISSRSLSFIFLKYWRNHFSLDNLQGLMNDGKLVQLFFLLHFWWILRYVSFFDQIFFALLCLPTCSIGSGFSQKTCVQIAKIFLCSIIMMTELVFSKLVTTIVCFCCSDSKGGHIDKKSFDFVNLNPMISCGLFIVCSIEVSVFMKIKSSELSVFYKSIQ